MHGASEVPSGGQGASPPSEQAMLFGQGSEQIQVSALTYTKTGSPPQITGCTAQVTYKNEKFTLNLNGFSDSARMDTYIRKHIGEMVKTTIISNYGLQGSPKAVTFKEDEAIPEQNGLKTLKYKVGETGDYKSTTKFYDDLEKELQNVFPQIKFKESCPPTIKQHLETLRTSNDPTRRRNALIFLKNKLTDTDLSTITKDETTSELLKKLHFIKTIENVSRLNPIFQGATTSTSTDISQGSRASSTPADHQRGPPSHQDLGSEEEGGIHFDDTIFDDQTDGTTS